MTTRSLCVVPGILLLGLVVSQAASGQDFKVLEERRPVSPEANRQLSITPPSVVAPRVLLAGDSWAQYMWDDGSHNDVLDKFGHDDHRALSLSLGSDPGPGYTGPEYAVSGSEARQWADTANYPWIANMVAALQANPTIDLVMLSIGGNDILAGKSGGGWYKDMDLDVPGSEAALFDRIRQDTFTIINAALGVRPDIRVMIASYEYPNFNVGFWCFVYACPKRRDLSRDPVNALVSDQELNNMMVRVEQLRIGWVNSNNRFLFDHAVGLMHYFYGDGVAAPRTLPYPGQTPPLFQPFPGGNPLKPTLRSNFRKPNGIDADPIHLNYDGYQYKITNQTQTSFFPWFRGTATATIHSQGGANDGWADGASFGTEGIRMGDNGASPYFGIISFDTSGLPEGAVVTGAALYLTRNAGTGTNPFTSGALGTPWVDVSHGGFGNPAVEASDAWAFADAADAGYAVGSARANGYAVRIEITGSGLYAVNLSGLTQFRISFPGTGGGSTPDYITFRDGDAGLPANSGLPTLADYMGTSAPFLDVTYSLPSGVPGQGPPVAGPLLRPNSPNPFSVSTLLRYSLAQAGPARIDVFDVSGRLVVTLVDAVVPEGNHTVIWDGRDGAGEPVASGLYLARLVSEGHSSTQRMMRVGR